MLKNYNLANYYLETPFLRKRGLKLYQKTLQLRVGFMVKLNLQNSLEREF